MTNDRALGAEVDALLAAGDRPAAWRALGSAGLFSALLQGDLLTGVKRWEVLGQSCGDLGFLFAANAHVWGGCFPLQAHAPAAVRDEWLPRLVSGEAIGAHAVSEPQAGSDVSAIETRWDDGRLTGTKVWITNGPEADLVVVYARDDAGLGGFFVPSPAEGLVSTEQKKMGLHGALMGRMDLDGVAAPESMRLGTPGSGMALFKSCLEWERACILAAFVGAMQRQLDAAVRHARSRKQFGQRIGAFQAVSHRIVDMKVRVETSRLMLYRAVTARAAGRAPVESAEAKLHIAEAFLTNSIDALRTVGAAGYLAGTVTADDVQAALGAPLFSGTSDLQREIVRRMLGL